MAGTAWRRIVATRAPASVVLIRLLVGTVFVSEGLQKFIFPAELGPGRFEKMGFAQPNVAYLVACFEAACGALLVIGLATRAAALPLIVVMITAIVTTKLPILVGHDLWGFHVRKLSQYGFWAIVHEARTDWAMLLGSIYLLIVGGGRWSIDAGLDRGQRQREVPVFAGEPRSNA